MKSSSRSTPSPPPTPSPAHRARASPHTVAQHGHGISQQPHPRYHLPLPPAPRHRRSRRGHRCRPQSSTILNFHADPSPRRHFGTSGSGDGQFSGNTGIAVDGSNGDLYVADTGNHRIVKLDSDGNFIRAFGWGVDDGTAAAQVCTSGCQAGISGSGAGQFDTPRFVAIDQSPSPGDVYVADTATYLVQKFDSRAT